ncbi:hypothetical protein L226DRAFT_610936 [Lentinus tigrinus ALCF2SS1-7]|uniref:Protein-S-isoprenylcysteine O-methyltransferase n=1 Tax=Lentinus tigrinus ALCF2SS1-6 TaxID=1328759 RepID=A0A5C2SFC6_9APHY|nr:hypothetical protein L227DRAFT_652019 [Lentinus tigrinus ALCF2SS1-6]RPD77700.1 hypothetical protein L226DRAFT_610936 [Lentinus tigrinus ALCF2SS1-7]
MHTPASVLLKIPLLVGILWANRVTYTAPTPVVTSRATAIPSEAGYLTVNLRPPWVRKASKLVVRSVVTVEVLYLLAAALFPSVVARTSSSTIPRLSASKTCKGIGITPSFALGWALLITGGFIRKACYREMGKNFTFELTIRKEHSLVTSGPYSIVRHPAYTAVNMVVAGTILCLFGKGSMLLECGVLGTWAGKLFALAWLAELLSVPSIMVFSRVRTEDAMLKKTFGQQWDEWASRTPYALLPWIY